MNEIVNASLLASREPPDLAALVRAVRTELESPSGQRSQIVSDAGSLLMAMPDDCFEAERVDTLLETGQLAYFEGRSMEGLAMVRKAADLALRAGHVPLERKALTYEAVLHADLGDSPGAYESTVGALVLARQLGEVSSEATLWSNLSDMLSKLGDWGGALKACQCALRLEPENPGALIGAAEACLERGHVVKGLKLARQCIEHGEHETSLQLLAQRAEAEALYGRILVEVEDVTRAEEFAKLAHETAERSTASRILPTVYALEGMCIALRGDAARGLKLLRKARDMRAHDTGIDTGQRQALRWTARLHRMLNDDASARAVLNEQAEMQRATTLQQLRTAATLPSSSAFQVVPGLCESRADAEPGSVYERFASVAVSLLESSGEHGYRVGDLAALLAADYGADNDEIAAARLGGALHDIGFFCIPSSILVKEDAFEEFEQAIFREHPVHGARLLEEARLPQGVLDAVRHHHERWDGAGFPFGLSGAATPLVARFVGIAEAFDEMVHSTVRNREPWTVRRALEELLRQRGKRFDPHLVDLLIERVRRLQREHGGLDEALSVTADRSTLTLARRRLRDMMDGPHESAR